MHRSPGGVTCEASFTCPPGGAPTASPGLDEADAYTPAMRRWVCIVALLAGFARDDYGRAARLREPVAIQRLLAPQPGGRGLTPTGAWWTRTPG